MKLLARAGKLLMRLGRFVTDSCRSVCCGCPVVRQYDRCTSSCGTEPPIVWICEPVSCQESQTTILYHGTCYSRTSIVIPIAQVPVGGVVLTENMYGCLPSCDDPQCTAGCGDYLLAYPCPGFDWAPPIAFELQGQTTIGPTNCTSDCLGFRWLNAINPATSQPEAVCYTLQKSGARFNAGQLPAVTVFYPQVGMTPLLCDYKCCDCVPGCVVNIRDQFSCNGPFDPFPGSDCSDPRAGSLPRVVGQLKCCCSNEWVVVVSGTITYSFVQTDNNGVVYPFTVTGTLDGQVSSPPQVTDRPAQWTLRFCEPFLTANGVEIVCRDEIVPYGAGNWCGIWAFHDIPFAFFSGGILGKCPSELCGQTIVPLDGSGGFSEVVSSTIQNSCSRRYRAGRWTAVIPTNFNTNVNLVYSLLEQKLSDSGRCGGGCGQQSPPPGSALSYKGGPYFNIATGCASCGASADIGSGGATI